MTETQNPPAGVAARAAPSPQTPAEQTPAEKDETMARAGRKPRTDVGRYRNGRIRNAERGERPEKIMAVALAQPHRKGNASPMAGYAFGRMFLGGMIDRRQFEAAETVTRRFVRYHRHITDSLPKLPSMVAELVAGTTGEGPELDVETVAKIRSEYRELQDALADSGLHHDGNAILMRVCVLDRDITDHATMGIFRCALNVIAHRLRLS